MMRWLHRISSENDGKPSTSLHLLCYLFRHTSSILLADATTKAHRLPSSPPKCWHSNCFSLRLARKHVITCSFVAYFSFHRNGIHNNKKSERWDDYETERCFKQQFMQSFDNYSQKNSAECLLRNDFLLSLCQCLKRFIFLTKDAGSCRKLLSLRPTFMRLQKIRNKISKKNPACLFSC